MVCPDYRCNYLDHNGYTYSPDPSLFNVSPAISKFRNVYEQMEDEYWREHLMSRLDDIALFVHRHRHIETYIRETAMWHGPLSQLGCWKRSLYRNGLHIPAEWRKQVEELLVSLKTLTAAQIRLMAWEMLELLSSPSTFHSLCRRRALQLKWEEEDLQKPVTVLEKGLSRSPLYFDHNG
jgi:hypothetical protein